MFTPTTGMQIAANERQASAYENDEEYALRHGRVVRPIWPAGLIVAAVVILILVIF